MKLISFLDFLNEVHIVDDKITNEFLTTLEHAVGLYRDRIADDTEQGSSHDSIFLNYLNSTFKNKKIDGTKIIFDDTIYRENVYDKILNVKDLDKIYLHNASYHTKQVNGKVDRIITFYFKKGCSNNVEQYKEFEDIIENTFYHEMKHKKQYEPIISRLESMKLTDDEFNSLYRNVYKNIHNSYAYNKKTLKELDDTIVYLKKHNKLDRNEIFKILDYQTENPYERRPIELAREFVLSYIEDGNTIYDIMVLLDKKPKKIDNILWDLDSENHIKHFIPDILTEYIKDHDSLKHELDADASTILLELSKIKKKEDVRKIIEKPTTNTPSATFNYYLKIFGVNDSYVIKDLKKRLGKYYVAFYSGVDKLTKKIK